MATFTSAMTNSRIRALGWNFIQRSIIMVAVSYKLLGHQAKIEVTSIGV